MRCEHFEREGLARQEAGRPDPHVDGCADCQAARATYRRLTDALGDVGADLRPRDGWEEQVLARIATPRRSRWWATAGVGAALAAAAIALLMLNRKPSIGDPVIARVPSGSATRGADAWTDGDNIYSISEAKGGAVWIYRGGKLVMGCDADTVDPPGCVLHGDGVRALLRTRLGSYDVFAFRQAAPGPAPAAFDEAKATVSRLERWGDHQHVDVR